LLDWQLEQIAAMAAAPGGLDCVILGNSLTLQGVDPDAFAAAYARRTGGSIRCYNFSIAGMRVEGALALARVLVEDYQPWLLVFGASGRDLNRASAAPRVHDVAWLRYRAGDFDAEGWLIDHSRAYGYFLTYRRWMDRGLVGVSRQPQLLANGFMPVRRITLPREEQFRIATEVLSPQLASGLAEEEIENLGRLLRLREEGLQVAIVEMPMHPDLYDWVKKNAVFYGELVRVLEDQARRHGAPFWRGTRDLPANGWADLWHLDATGAAALSDWLGERVGEAVLAGKLTAPARAKAPPAS
jgi:hypothetical protein